MTREEVLQAAAKCVNGDRQEDYGSPENNFGLVAAFWNAIFAPVCARTLSASTRKTLRRCWDC